MTKTMLLIDADNVSTDVMEQAVSALLQEHGALHVRRAYCTAESALKHQQLFKRLGIRPMVNLAAGKNSTDIAMAVDALDLAISERPDVIAIASSDSDFAPLVARLREKGCRVVGIGQQGKTGDETQTVYDQFTVLAHRGKPAPARKTATRTRGRAAVPAPLPAPVPAPVPAPAAEPSPAPARKTTRRKPAAAPAPAPSAAPPAEPAPDKLRQILMAMPELVRGDTVELRIAADRLREAGLLSKSGSSTKVFGAYAERFELLPAKNPNKVRLKA
ncbi:MAG: NYN domain-containing protein [Rubrivivax sp.]|nr:NYN domain-containing protein [Rubrivivax sp.]